MGTPEFAVPSLEILLKNNYNVVAVVTVPDKPAGRGQQMQESAVKKFVVQHNIEVLQPVKLKDEQFLERLKALKADLQIVVAFRMLPEAVWNMPPLGTYNLHASLLPKYRGAAPINWAIINGESESGVTTFKLQHEIDTGSVLFQEKIKISDDCTAGELHDRLMSLGAETMLRSVKAIENGDYTLHKQDDSKACHAPKLFRDTCRIDWNKPLTDVYNLVRGLSPYPAAFTEFDDRQGARQSLKILLAGKKTGDHSQANGLVVTDGKSFIHVACEGGYLAVDELQLQGKKRMGAAEFLRGYRFPDNCVLS